LNDDINPMRRSYLYHADGGHRGILATILPEVIVVIRECFLLNSYHHHHRMELKSFTFGFMDK
jgi:hypothetical protein